MLWDGHGWALANNPRCPIPACNSSVWKACQGACFAWLDGAAGANSLRAGPPLRKSSGEGHACLTLEF